MNIEEADMAASLIEAGERLGYVQIADSQRFEPGAGPIADGKVVLGGLPHYVLGVEEARAGFEALRRPVEVLQVVFTYG
jgi:hypothetical protein